MTSRRLRHRGSGIFALYVIASLLPISVIGAALVRGYSDAGFELGRDQGRAQAAVIEQMAIAPALWGADLSAGLSIDERERLQSATDLAIFKGSVSHLRLRSFTGAVAFSDDGSVLGSVPVSDPAFRAAAAGDTDVRILEHESPATIRVLQPVIAAANGRATGVLEVYLPYDAIATKVQAGTRDAITRLAVSLVGLFGVLALISWWTTRALRQTSATHEHQSLHDSLTGIPNRQLFLRTAQDALARSHGRRGERGALVLIDLDHFKEVNDTLGHQAGDELLQIVAQRLSESLRTDDTVARLGGDEFGLVLPHAGGREETVALLTRVRHELSEKVVLNGVSLSVVASFGVCFYPEGAENLEQLLRHADAAMYQGKNGPAGVVVYEPGTPQHATHVLVDHDQLLQALAGDELQLHYQPKVERSTGRVSSLEALVRWQHPDRGLLLPAEFLPVAEGYPELIDGLTSWALKRALTDCAEWTRAGHDWAVAVNTYPRNLASLEFAEAVSQILEEAPVGADRLHLEVTEVALTFQTVSAEEVIGALAAQGISIAIDDFSTGFTGLSKLRSVQVSEVKIDRKVLADLLGKENDRSVLRSVMDLGHSLGFLVTAVGVESQEVADVLITVGCDQAQGSLWVHPSPWTDVAKIFGDTASTASSGTSTRQSAQAQAGHGSEGAAR